MIKCSAGHVLIVLTRLACPHRGVGGRWEVVNVVALRHCGCCKRSVVRKACCEVVKERLMNWVERERVLRAGQRWKAALLGKAGRSLVMEGATAQGFRMTLSGKPIWTLGDGPMSPDHPEPSPPPLAVYISFPFPLHHITAAQN